MFILNILKNMSGSISDSLTCLYIYLCTSITRVRISSNDILKHSAEEALSSFVSKLTDVARKIQTTDYSILLERQLLASEYEVLDEHL